MKRGVFMNDTINTIKQRRSIRRFKSDMVPTEIINQIIEAGLYAPSGMNRQTPIIITVTNKEIRDHLSRTNASIMGKDTDPFYGAPVILIVLASRERGTYINDGSLTMGNLMLAAHSFGLGSCWIHRAKETFEIPEWKQWLKSIGVDGDYEGIGHVALGYIDGEYPLAPERKENRIFFVQ